MALRRLGAEVVVGNLHDVAPRYSKAARGSISACRSTRPIWRRTNMAVVCEHHGVDACVNVSQMTVHAADGVHGTCGRRRSWTCRSLSAGVGG